MTVSVRPDGQHWEHPTRGYLVRCSVCGWQGYRRGYPDCECYEDWVMYCRPWSPGPGCPRWVEWPCPEKHLIDGRVWPDDFWRTSDSAVRVVTGEHKEYPRVHAAAPA
jgi:hypothetical protein